MIVIEIDYDVDSVMKPTITLTMVSMLNIMLSPGNRHPREGHRWGSSTAGILVPLPAVSIFHCNLDRNLLGGILTRILA